MRILKNMLEERKQKPNKVKADFFDHVLEELKQANTILIEEIALDLITHIQVFSLNSAEDIYTLVYFLLFQDTRQLTRKTRKPVIDFLDIKHLAQLESAKVDKSKPLLLLNKRPFPGVDFRYLNK
ncbi:hypothetical protein HanRHA438_Chr16g0745211 [Helianthus annuus]|nr:hypothetical protein HanRHA438_Chr16g0745211 [Helianthus annuus]